MITATDCEYKATSKQDKNAFYIYILPCKYQNNFKLSLNLAVILGRYFFNYYTPTSPR